MENEWTKEKIEGMLQDPETYAKLREMGRLRDEIWLLHRHINECEWATRKVEMEIQDTHKLSMTQMLDLMMMADVVAARELKKNEHKTE